MVAVVNVTRPILVSLLLLGAGSFAADAVARSRHVPVLSADALAMSLDLPAMSPVLPTSSPDVSAADALAMSHDASLGDAPDPTLLRRARDARDCAARKGLLDPSRSHKLAVIDFTRPSSAPRLWVLDATSGAVLLRERVAHGKNTGVDSAQAFSDEPGSLQSSLGLFVTAEPYLGKHGESMRLDGLEPGINGRARERAIVVHGADYATDEFVAEHGRLGRSFGCPAVAPHAIQPLIDAIAEGTPLFAWHADSDWDRVSALSRCSSL